MAKRSRAANTKRAAASAATLPPVAAASDEDKRLAAAARAKELRGETPTLRERGAAMRVKRQQERQLRQLYYRTIPRRDWLKAAQHGGTSRHVVEKQVASFGIPIVGDEIDLLAFVAWFHAWLADNADALAAAKAGGELEPWMMGDSPALERLRIAKAGQEEIKLTQMQGTVIDRADVHDYLMAFATALRTCEEKFERRFGREAADMFDQALDVGARAVEKLAAEQPPEREDE